MKGEWDRYFRGKCEESLQLFYAVADKKEKETSAY
ncbi:unknown protein [Simkania negevensis Z]|uniref:Uncharacterized protein n=1 Tax=Simkania negevensis (strain ATCC VR-1471 / DSM 27360 / Z) TaxID=331113 RepID=F8L3Q7_SIMNZ|nr:unknown protein [Simkania negevensis Z]